MNQSTSKIANAASVCRRLAALLATLALLASMTLPVYAEALETADAAPAADAPQTTVTETVSDDAATSAEDPTAPDTTGTGESTEDAAEDENSAVEPTETPDTDSDTDEANNQPTEEPTQDETTLPQETPTVDANEDDSADADTLEADVANEDAIATYTLNNGDTFSIYFLAPAGWDTNADITFYGWRANDGDNNQYVCRAQDTGKTVSDGRTLYKVDAKYGDSVQCPNHGYKFIQIQQGNNWVQLLGHKQNKDNEYWMTADELVGIYVDFGKLQATFGNNVWDSVSDAVQPLSNLKIVHTTYAGKPMRFKNESNTDLTNVTAVFYDTNSNGNLTEVARKTIGDIAANDSSSAFTIPTESCTYVQFVSGNTNLSACYNFYNESDGENPCFEYNSATACVFVYKGTDDSANTWTSGTVTTVYFDSTFSKLSYNGDNKYGSNLPNDQDVLYYSIKNASGTVLENGQATKIDDIFWSVTVPENAAQIRFSGWNLQGIEDNPTDTGSATDWIEIPTAYNKPCFVADTGDDSINKKNKENRAGYWAEKDSFHDAETAKGRDVVDIKEAAFVNNSSTKYIKSTLYDYYSDWELNGNNRDSYPGNFEKSQLSWAPFRQLDQAISDYYAKSGSDIKYPIYTGHFQTDGGSWPFSDIAGTLSLYGWDNNYRVFMAANNSNLDAGEKGSGKYDYAFQGIVGQNLVNGNPVMSGKNGTTELVEPHFNEDFLTKDNSKKARLGEVYHDVSFPFTKKEIFGDEPGVNYWWFDSANTSLYLRKDSTTDKLYLGNDGANGFTAGTLDSGSCNVDSSSTTGDIKAGNGFFPFNETATSKNANTYNYGYGAKLEIPFTLTSDGTVKDKNGDNKPIRFYFSGDDDVWVFIDGVLALDIGGAHGKVSGVLEFDKKAGNADNIVTSYVSQVKYNQDSNDYGSTNSETPVRRTINYTPLKKDENYYKQGTVEIPNLYTGQHKLTLYYMERGMWESNMAVAFNFPDHNELEVEKEVKLDTVNPIFQKYFKNQDLFAFNIKNLATHYGAKDASISTGVVNDRNLTASDYQKTSYIADSNNKNNYLEQTNNTNEGEVQWFAARDEYDSAYRMKRYGEITLNSAIDISQMAYLSFDVKPQGSDLKTSTIYLQLLDENDNILGCVDKVNEKAGSNTYINKALYNNALTTLTGNVYTPVKLKLSGLTNVDNKFSGKVSKIRIGSDKSQIIYFKNFTFSAQSQADTMTGFTTAQKDIPDYTSVASGRLENAYGARFTSNVAGKTGTYIVDKDGIFQLQDKETITFRDQFRRGSYISINELADDALYDTTWTIYENGTPVTDYGVGTKKKVTIDSGTNTNLDERTGTAPQDGRTESDNAERPSNYNGIKPTDANTIVFRSYSNPDAEEEAELTKLKVKFVNTVKTGQITIIKAAAKDEEDLINGTYTFKITYTNVGGQNLEDKPIEQEVTINGQGSETIPGIPLGTHFTIEEVKSKDGSNLQKVSVNAGCDATVVKNQTVEGTVTNNDIKVKATFTNTMHNLIDISLTKKWQDANGNDVAEKDWDNLPQTIYVQLQRRLQGQTPQADWAEAPYPEQMDHYIAINRDDGGWHYTFTNLDADVYDSQSSPKPKYEYRVVEGTLENGEFTPKPDDQTTIVLNGKVYQVTGGEETTEDGKHTITLTNKLQNPKFNLDVIKKSAENETFLDGVEFTLDKLDESGNAITTDGYPKYGITNDQGQLMLKDENGEVTTTKAFENLDAGTYRLTETKTKAGYSLLSGPIEIKFTQQGGCQLNGAAADSNIFKPNPDGSYTLALTVLNRKVPELPHTGADAPSLWLLIGLPLAVAGLLVLVFRYNKKGGRTK